MSASPRANTTTSCRVCAVSLPDGSLHAGAACISRAAAIAGTLLAIPVVNAYGFLGRSRYLPDRHVVRSKSLGLELAGTPLVPVPAHALPVAKLKRVFASILYLLAAYMLWKGVTS